MVLKVKKGYAVFYGGLRYEAGCLLPASSLNEVILNQSWKVEEVKNGEQERKESKEREETTAATSSDGEEKEIESIVNNRAMKPTDVKKKYSNTKKNSKRKK